MASFFKAVFRGFDNWTSTGRLLGFAFLALSLWLIGLMPLMPGGEKHIQGLLAFVALGAIVFALAWILRRYHYHSYLIAILASAVAAPTYLLFRQMFIHSEFVLTLVVIGVSARWGRGPGLVSTVLVWLSYGFVAGAFIGKPETVMETLIVGGFFVSAAIIVGTIAQHRESALAARSRALAELEQTYEATLRALISALDVRDHDTEGHSERVTALALAIADEMKMNNLPKGYPMFSKPYKLILFSFLGFMLLAALPACSSTSANQPGMMPLRQMPAEVRNAPVAVQQAYQFAAANPDTMKQIPCYCGCGAMGHTSNYSCYVQSVDASGSLTFDNHALGCSICVDITQDMMRLQREGKSIAEIRAYVDNTYSKYGPSNMP